MSGGQEIYIEGSPAERRAVHLDADGHAVAIEIDRPTRPRLTGGVYLARVTAVDKRLGAAFLDIGTGTPALLAKAKELQQGQAVLVQVIRDSHDTKGPAASRQITLWGRYTALQTGRGGGLQCSRALGQGKRQAETLAKAEAALTDSTDIILRNAASAAEGTDLAAEVDGLRALWDSLQAEAKTGNAPAPLLPPPDFIDLTLREAGPDARIALDDRMDHAVAERLAAERYPDLQAGLLFYRDSGAMFDTVGISDILEAALTPTVSLQGSGSITIEETRALTAIDVDMGGGEAETAQKEEAIHRLNRRAAEEIARQILLRRLGGLIVIDFAGFKNRGKMKTLLDILRSRLKGAEGHADVLGISAAGLVEITRQRTGPSLAALCQAPDPSPAPASDAEAADALRRVLRLTGAGKPVLGLSNAAADLLTSGAMKAARLETEKRLGQPLILQRGAIRPDIRLER